MSQVEINHVVERFALSIAKARGQFAETLESLQKAGFNVEYSPAVQAVLGKLVIAEETKETPIP